MKKKLLVLLTVVLFFSLFHLAEATHAQEKKKASFSNSTILLNGDPIYIQGYNIDNYNYFKLRDVAAAFVNTTTEFDVRWNNKANAIEILSLQPYKGEPSNDFYYQSQVYATPTSASIVIDGKVQPLKTYTINSAVYFQLRDLASIIGFELNYHQETDTIQLGTKAPENAYLTQTKEAVTNNNLTSFYYPRWSSPVTDYVYVHNDQTLTAVEAGEKIKITTYNSNFELLSSAELPYELPIFGAFYSGEKYNYIAYGQTNTEQNPSKEVIRIVKYDKNFKKIDSLSILGRTISTTIPFDAGSGRIAEKDHTLVFHTSRERYTSSDGLNHQSQLTFVIDTNTMVVKNDTSLFQKNHVSHSFDQYVLFDGQDHVLLDHGDAYPRSIVIQKGNGFNYIERDVVNIPGAIGANMTGVSIGGFEQSSSSYLVAYNSMDHAKATAYTSFEVIGTDEQKRDIKIAAIPRDNIENGTITYTHIASYIGTEKRASIPKLVKINEGKFMLLWQEFESNDHNAQSILKYVYLDHQGKMQGGIEEKKYFHLSTVQPIVHNHKVIWYTDNGANRTFYTIPIK